MKKIKISLLILISLVIVGLVLGLVSQANPDPMTRKIVVFKSGVEEITKENLIKKHGAIKIKELDLINGKAIFLSPKATTKLLEEKEVLRVDEDVEVFTLAKSDKFNRVKPQPLQQIPWGIDRIDAEKVWGITTGDPIKVAIIDTGIDLNHPDLKDNIKEGMNTINPRKTYNDDNGHGTHVAGIVAALDNTIGVVGVGPKIDLYIVKSLNAAGSGYLSDIIEGLEWAIQKRVQVINMSLGTPVDVPSFREAVKKVYNAGILQVAAAGNEGGAVNYPAAYPEVIAVSATDQNDQIASWSSRGPEIDLAAPGVSIYSTYKGSSYKTLSGTSMAAPHVAGVAALILSVPEKCDYDTNNICSPSEIKQKLEETAEKLGDSYLYGSGLVNAEKAVIQ